MKAMLAWLAVWAILITGCATITIKPGGGATRLASSPTYSDWKAFYFWGLAGEQHVNVQEVCGDKKVVQMQAQDSSGIRLVSILTLGIYTPRTAKVWCE